MARLGSRDQKQRSREGDVEVDYNRRQTRLGVGLLNQDQKYWVWFKGGGGGT